MTTTDEAKAIVEYQDAVERLKAVEDETRKVVDIVSRAGSLLMQDRWKVVLVSGTTSHFPQRVADLPPDAIINGSNWPEASRIAEALSNWHNAQDAVEAKWAALPTHRRTALKEPEKAPRYKRGQY